MATELSSRQREMLGFIREYIGAFGYAPSHRDIVAGTDIASTSNVAYNLRLLRAQGLVDFDEEVSRSLRLPLDDRSKTIVIPYAGWLHSNYPAPVPVPDLEEPLTFSIVPTQLMGAAEADAYAVEVVGWTFADIGIADGDVLVVDRGGGAIEADATYITWGDMPRGTEIVRGCAIEPGRTIRARLRCLVRIVGAP